MAGDPEKGELPGNNAKAEHAVLLSRSHLVVADPGATQIIELYRIAIRRLDRIVFHAHIRDLV